MPNPLELKDLICIMCIYMCVGPSPPVTNISISIFPCSVFLKWRESIGKEIKKNQ